MGRGINCSENRNLTANPKGMKTLPETVDESLIWVADLLESLDLTPMSLADEDPEEDPAKVDTTAAETAVIDLTPEEISQSSEALTLPEFDYDPEQDGSVLDALFGWIGDLLSSLFGGNDAGDDMAGDPDAPADPIDNGPDPLLVPADVSADIVMNAVEPDQDYLDQLEEELAALDLM